jgi:hypothetical protein
VLTVEYFGRGWIMVGFGLATIPIGIITLFTASTWADRSISGLFVAFGLGVAYGVVRYLDWKIARFWRWKRTGFPRDP